MYQTPQKLSKKKIIELCILIFLILWGIIFIINYIRYSNSEPLIMAIHVSSEYEDGVVDEYISLGYIYRSYRRVSISREELVPFWVLKENPESEVDLPEILTDYEVPENIRHEDKYRGLLYYYNIKGELLGTYKCINSVGECEKATSGYDEYNITNADPLTKLETQRTLTAIHDKYAFVDDSSEQDVEYGNNNFLRTIYLINFLDEEKEIIAKYADVKESTHNEDKNVGDGENYRYIVRSAENNKWGVIYLSEKGNITEIMPFEYDSINYDEDTGYYILCKDGSWYIYDLQNEKTVSATSTDPIYDVWRNDNLTYYYKTGKERTVGDETFIDYKVYRIDGKIFLNVDRVTLVEVRSNCIFYLTANDSVLHFIDYSNEEKYKVQLAFSNMEKDSFNHPAFEIAREYSGIIVLHVYQGRDLKYDFESIPVNTVRWESNEER